MAESTAEKIEFAKLTIKGLPTLEAKNKKRLVAWLRKTADLLEKEKDQKVFAKSFAARLFK